MSEEQRSLFLQQLVDGLKTLHNSLFVRLGSIEVVFHSDDGDKITFDLAEALDAIVNDVYIYEDFDLRNATKLTVGTI